MASTLDLQRLRAQVRALEFRTRRTVTSSLLGNYRSAFRGQGLVYADSREYIPGDEIKHLNWKASSRSGRLMIKTHEEERQLNIMVALDTSRSMELGRKHEQSVKCAALIAMLAERSRDWIGLCTFSRKVDDFVPPRRAGLHFQTLVGRLLRKQPEGNNTNLAAVFNQIALRMKKRGVVFVISDFFNANYREALARLAARHEVVCLMIHDPVDLKIPLMGQLHLEESDERERILYDTLQTQGGYQKIVRSTASTCGQAGADMLLISGDPLKMIARLMHERSRAGARPVIITS